MLEGVGQVQREKQTDSQQEEKRIVALTAMVVGRGKEVRLVLCLSRAKGTFPLQWSCISVLTGVWQVRKAH